MVPAMSDDYPEAVIPLGYDRLSEKVTVYWYEHDCDWITKYCDEHHKHSAQVMRIVLDTITYPSN